jgi:ribosomal protein L24
MNIMMKMVKKKNDLVEDARQKALIKEEEEITKSNVKTLIDAEHAEIQRKKLAEQRFVTIQPFTNHVRKNYSICF